MFVHVIKDSSGCATVRQIPPSRQTSPSGLTEFLLFAVPGWPERIRMPDRFFTTAMQYSLEDIDGLTIGALTVKTDGTTGFKSKKLSKTDLGISDWTELDKKIIETSNISKLPIFFDEHEFPIALEVFVSFTSTQYISVDTATLKNACGEYNMTKMGFDNELIRSSSDGLFRLQRCRANCLSRDVSQHPR